MPQIRLLWLALIALTGGCATVTPPASLPEPALRAVASSFALSGRLSANDRDRAATGRLEWEHAPDADVWLVFSPLGQIVAQLVAGPDGATLRTADGRKLQRPSAELLLPELLGMPAPVDGLAYWVQAAPRAGASVLARDAIGRPARISDSGWIIDYAEYASPAPDAMPRRIDAVWGEARIRLVIDAWASTP